MRQIGLLLLVIILARDEGIEAREVTEGHQSADSSGPAARQKTFNKLVVGADHLYTDFKSNDAAVTQSRAAFLLCARCPYTGPQLRALGFQQMFGIDHLVDRQYITDSIFPALKNLLPNPAYLWVGVQPYTTRYEYILRQDGASSFDTIELDPTQAIFGSSQKHIVDKAQNIDKHIAAETYDVVIANGVLGWGIDSAAEISEFFFTQARVLKPGGYFIIGYNPHIGTNHVAGIEEHFKKVTIGNLPQKKSFDIEWKHVYEFYQKNF